MTDSLLNLPIEAIDHVVQFLDCRSICRMVKTCRAFSSHIRRRIKIIFRDLYMDKIIRSFLFITKTEVKTYTQFLKVANIIEDDYIREYYYYKGIARETRKRALCGSRNHSKIPENEITDGFHRYIEFYMRCSIMSHRSDFNSHRYYFYGRNKQPPQTLNHLDREYQMKMYRLNCSIRSLIGCTLSTFHDLTLVEYLLTIRNFLYHAMNQEQKRNTMKDTKNVIKEYREMQARIPMPKNHMGYFYFYMLLKYHDMNRTLLSDYNSHFKTLDCKSINYYGFNQIRPDYFEPYYKFFANNIDTRDYVTRFNIMIRIYKNVYLKIRKLAKKNIKYFISKPGGYQCNYYRYNDPVDMLYIDYHFAEDTSLKLSTDIIQKNPQYESVNKLFRKGFILPDNNTFSLFGGTLRTISRYNLTNQKINDIMILCNDYNIGGVKALEIACNIDFHMGNFAKGYETIEKTYKYKMEHILLFLSKHRYQLPPRLGAVILEFEEQHISYYFRRHHY